MAGFFGLFDYNKPGPGVDKNAPKKKGFVVFFEIFFRKFWKLITANLLYVVVSLPLLTNGLAHAGLTFIARNFAREKHAFVAGDFFDTIKKNWKQALPVGIVNLVLTVVLAFDIWFFYVNATNWVGYIMLAVILTATIVFFFMKYYQYMLIITFKLSLKNIYKNSLILAFAGMKRNLLISLVLIPCYVIGTLMVLTFQPLLIILVFFLYIFIFPAFRSYLIQYNVFPLIKKLIIDPYYKEHPGEDKEAKRALNIEEDMDNPEEEEDVIFQDRGRTDKEETQEEETSKRRLPKQYNEQELHKGRRITRQNTPDDDDDTI